MPDYVAYHSASIMGHPYEAGERFEYVSSKPESALRRAVGNPVWVIASERAARKTNYFLVGVFSPSALTATNSGWIISGDGYHFEPAIEITKLPWFRELLREQSNFSLGFNQIRSRSITSALEQLRADHRPSQLSPRPATPGEQAHEDDEPVRLAASKHERDPSFNHAETFALIARVITASPGDHEGFVNHGTILAALLLDPNGADAVSRARVSTKWPDDKSCASNMVAWFSQQITVGHSPWTDYFDRERREGAWAYRPKTAVRPPIAADLELSAVEGDPRLFFHLRRERDPLIADAKRRATLALHGHLRCEACGLDPRTLYPSDICEIHHRRPLAEAIEPKPTQLEDLAVLCPNCHRAIHRTSPVMAVEDFRGMLLARANEEAG